MTRIELARDIANDLDRIIDHLTRFEVEHVEQRVEEIMQAIDVLKQNPLICRPVSNDKRELIIGRRVRGYVAQYRYMDEIDTVFILGIRSQREAGYS